MPLLESILNWRPLAGCLDTPLDLIVIGEMPVQYNRLLLKNSQILSISTVSLYS